MQHKWDTVIKCCNGVGPQSRLAMLLVWLAWLAVRPGAGTAPCPAPPLPLAATATLDRRDTAGPGAAVRAQFSCQQGFHPLGDPRLHCRAGDWDPVQFQCTVDAARAQPTFYGRNVSEVGSGLTVDGVEGRTRHDCDIISPSTNTHRSHISNRVHWHLTNLLSKTSFVG